MSSSALTCGRTCSATSVHKILAVALGAAVGANCRYWLNVLIGQHSFPFATLAVNVSGSFLIGLFLGAKPEMSETTRLLLVTGLLGGYTTYSAFAFETHQLEPGAAAIYFTATSVLGLLGVHAGLAAGTLWAR